MELDASVVWDFAGELVGTLTQRKGSTLATVTRIDPDGTTWVTTDGDGEAPAAGVAAGVAVGDTVALEWEGATMGIRANVSDPAPTGAVVRHAQRVASAAQKVADAVNQHFFADTHGIHVTEATQEDWEQSHTGPNVLINSIGQLFRDGLNNLLTLTTENGARALTIWDGAGNAAANVLAVFGEIVRIGRAAGYHIIIGGSGIQFFGNSDATNPSVNVFGSPDGGEVSFYKQGASIRSQYVRGVESYLDLSSTAVTSGESAMTTLKSSSGTGSGVRRALVRTLAHDSDARVTMSAAVGTDSSAMDMSPTGIYFDGSPLYSENPIHVSNVDAVGPEDISLNVTSDSIGLYDHYDEDWLIRKSRATRDVYVNGELYQHGSVGQTTSVPAGGYADVPVTFARAYDSTPTVVVGMLSTSTSSEIGLCSVALESASATGFTARLFNAGASARRPSFCWIAMG